MELFITITFTFSIIILLVLCYMTYMLVKIRSLKKQINLHKDKKIDTNYIMSSTLPLLLLSVNTMIGIDLSLFIIMCTLVGYCVYITEEYNNLTKELLKIMEDEKHAKMES